MPGQDHAAQLGTRSPASSAASIGAGGPVILRFDASLHSGDAIQRAAYRFIDRCTADIRRDGGDYLCRLSPHDDASADRDGLEADFRVEVLDQVLRERIRAETMDVRNLILALAFSQTGLVEQ